VREVVISIAGFDGSAGAGILADIKTFQQCGVDGMGVLSALTVQNETEVRRVSWIEVSEIIEQLKVLSKNYNIKVCKIGIIQNLDVLEIVLNYLRELSPTPFIIWDPILKSSSGFIFHNEIILNDKIISQIDLITPNYIEAQALTALEAEHGAEKLSRFCSVVLKGGHSSSLSSNDVLFIKGERYQISGARYPNSKHGTGCVFSASLAAAYYLNPDLFRACQFAKDFTRKYLLSSGEELVSC
jgi:hydroxymethylpyrimidine/phosphomethylpyrimidine kinase